MTWILNKLVCRTQIIPVVVLIDGHEDGVDKDHQDNEIVKHGPADELDSFISNAVAFV